MPRKITVTLEDGATHIYENVPDDVTPEQVTVRAEQEFGKAVTALDGGRNGAVPPVIPSSQTPQVQVDAGVSQVVAQPKVTQDAQEVYEMGADRALQGYDNYDVAPLSEEDAAEYVRLSRDLNVPIEQLSSFLAQRGKTLAPSAASELKEYRKAIQEGRETSSNISYVSAASSLLGDYEPEQDTTMDSDFGFALEKGMAYNPMGILTRLFNDFTDSEIGGLTKADIQKLYPDLDADGIENIHDSLIGEMRRRELINANYQVDSRDVNPLVDFAGDVIGGASPVDLIPLGRGTTIGRRVAESAGANFAVDAALQGSDVAYEAQQAYDPMQGFVAAASGAALQGGLELGAKGLQKVFRRTPETPPPASERAPIVVPEADGRSKAYKKAVADAQTVIIDQVNELTQGWTNAPEITVYENFKELKGVDNTAIGVYTTKTLEDGSVVPAININTAALLRTAKKREVTPESLVEAVTFHESLGHHGLLSLFENDLELFLDDIYTNGDAKFRKEVDNWLTANPTAYGALGEDRRRIFATEEVLAEASEKGPLTLSKLDSLANYIKDFARTRLGVNLKYSQREIRSYLAVAHDRTMRGQKTTTTPKVSRNARGDDRIRLTRRFPNKEGGNVVGPEVQAAKTFLSELEVFNNNELRQMAASDAIQKAERLGIDEDWLNYYNDSYLRSYGYEAPNTPQPDMSRYLPNVPSKYMQGDRKTPNEGDFERRVLPRPTFVPEGKAKSYAFETGKPVTVEGLHGTSAEFENFDPSYLGYLTGTESAKQAFWFATREKTARTYAAWSSRDRWFGNERKPPRIVKRAIQLNNPLVVDMKSKVYREESFSSIVAQAKEAGHDGVILRNAYDSGEVSKLDAILQGNFKGENLIAVFDPKNILRESPETGAKYMRGDRKTPDEGDFERRMTNILEEIRDAYVPTERSQAEARRAASLAGLRSRQYKSQKGLDDLDVRLFQYDAVNDRYQEKLLRIAEKMENPKDANEYVTASDNFKKTLYEYKLLAAKIQGDQAQIGRALNAMKAINLTKRKINETLGILDETFGNKTEAEAFAALDDPEVLNTLVKLMSEQIRNGNKLGAAKIAEKVGKPYWWQYVLSYLHNSMLSGLGTHAVNAYDAVNVLGRKLEERVVGGAIGSARKAVGAKDTMSAMEGVGFTYGILRAAVDAETYRNTYRAFKEGYEFQPFDAKIERQDARIPGLSRINDLLYASDMFWRSFHMSANLYSLGIRKAYKEGFTGKALFEEGYANAINADKELMDEAKLHADEALLVDTPSSITSWVEAGKNIKPNMTAGQQARAFTLNLLFPFLRVSDRLIFQALKRVPVVAFIDHNTRREWGIGGAARDAVLARQMMGAALLSYYWMQADPKNADEEGYIEGYGDPNYQKTMALEATGYRAETVTEEDQVMRNANQINITANPFNTRNNLAVLVASIRQGWERSKKTEEDANEAALLLTSAMRAGGTFIMKQGYADNVTPYVQALKADPQQETSVANAAAELATRAVPALVRQLNQMYFDPVKRDTTGDKSFDDRVLGRVQAGIPGLSNLMPANVTALGDEQQHGRTLLRLGDGTPIKQDDPYTELRKLEREIPEPVLTEFRGSFTFEGQNIKLNSFEKNKWQAVQGQYLKDAMLEWVSSPEWKEMAAAEKQELVKDLKSEAYDYAKEELLPEILQARGLTVEPE